MEIQILFIITAAVFVLVGALAVLKAYFNVGKKKYTSPYSKQSRLFKTGAEEKLFVLLNEIYGERYYIFPQVHFSAVIEVNKKRVDWKDVDKYRSRADRKAADFVLCEKGQGAPVALIELGGDTHNFPTKEVKESFINDISDIQGLPLVMLGAGSINRAAVERAVGEALPRSAV